MTPCAHDAVTADGARFTCQDCGNRIPTRLTPADLTAVEIALTGRRTA